MTSVAVIAHSKKCLGGGLPELRQLLADRGIEPIWYEVRKSRKAPAKASRAVEQGADLLLVWGGDGTVQRCLEVVAGSDTTIAVIPAGTANLLASNLGIPADLEKAVDIALAGRRRRLDLGVINGEHFAVMGGAGFDALMMGQATSGLKDRFGRAAYIWSGVRASKMRPSRLSIKVDGSRWFKGRASCLLLGNMGTLTGGLIAFPEARPDDGLLEVGVVGADGPLQWVGVLARLLAGKAQASQLVRTTRGRQIEVKLNPPLPYEVDGGTRSKAGRLHARVLPRAVTVCFPDRNRQ